MRFRTVLLTVLAALLIAPALRATENGGGAYPNGAEGFLTGLVPPPPGMYLIDYALYYGADSFKDGNGDSIPGDFDLEIWGNVLRLINVTDTKILGAQWVQHIFIPVLSVDVTTPGGSDDKIGLGDLIVDPIVLAWHGKNWHCAAGVDVYVPVGEYDENDLANIGRNYWTIEPVFAVTYLNEQGCEASAKFMYDINLENDDTNYESGDEFHVDFALGHRLDNWILGAGGFYYKQIGDDDGTVLTPAGPADAGDNKGQAIGLGPQLGYQHKGMTFILKYQKEFEVENKFEGDRVWFKLITAL